MKAAEIRQMSTEELKERLRQEQENLARMKFQVSTSQLTNTSLIALTRKDVARMKTILHQRVKTEETRG